MAAVKWWLQNRGLLSTALNGDVKVSGSYREGDQFSLKGVPLQIFSREGIGWLKRCHHIYLNTRTAVYGRKEGTDSTG